MYRFGYLIAERSRRVRHASSEKLRRRRGAASVSSSGLLATCEDGMARRLIRCPFLTVARRASKDEAALLRPPGPPEVMREQLRHIVDICEELPTVQLQIVPLSKGVYGSQHGMFTLIEPRDPGVEPVAYVDSAGGNLYLQRPGQIQRFRRMFGDLQAIALDPNESLDLLRERC